LFCLIIQLKIKLDLRACRLFGPGSERTKSSKSTPRPLILFGSSPPCTYTYTQFQKAAFSSKKRYSKTHILVALVRWPPLLVLSWTSW